MEVVGNEGSCYYSVLGICRQASDTEIRGAYRKLALKWHPDRRMRDRDPVARQKTSFSKFKKHIQGKRRIYDAGLLDLPGKDDHDNDNEFDKFMQEMISMIEREKSQEERSLEDLRRLLVEMIDGDERLKFPFQPTQSHQPAPKRRRMKTTTGL
ncbi:UNVERIFIED_CONTAM: Chaperone protein DnaJ 1 [Sesamum latifolium]|uniref:Chaperone protein DnaJ 1 n=1 Tax=Sesamum latifolium TaxID=2727402 RepID=A0AAW2XW50_9LAMI